MMVRVVSDDAAVMITLTVRQLNPDAFIVAAVRQEENVPLMRQSGANSVITSSEAVGRLLGLSTDATRVVDDLTQMGYEGLDTRRDPATVPGLVVHRGDAAEGALPLGGVGGRSRRGGGQRAGRHVHAAVDRADLPAARRHGRDRGRHRRRCCSWPWWR